MANDKTNLVITQHIETIGESNTFTVEANMVSKRGRPPMFDLRLWSKDNHSPMNGLSMRDCEVERLRDLLNEITFSVEEAREV